MTGDELRVPLGKPVKLLINSEDVLHSLYIPAYRIKEDAVPGLETYLWFYPDEKGNYDLFCAEYCGMGHSAMITKVVVMGKEDFAKWYKSRGKSASPKGKEEGMGHELEEGRQLAKKLGCLGCHSTDGSKLIGPSFKGLYMREETVITKGIEGEAVADEEYIIRSILDPTADIVKGYPPIMPSQKGSLSDENLKEIVKYLKELK
jgi:cytochrome c oxidase subunit 2